MFRNRSKARHLARRSNTTAYAEARARGGHTTTEDGVSILPRRSAHRGTEAPLPELLGLEDVHITLDRADTRFADVEAQCAEVRRMFDTPIDTTVVAR